MCCCMLHCRLTFNVQHIPLEDNVPVQGRLEILVCLLMFNIIHGVLAEYSAKML